MAITGEILTGKSNLGPMPWVVLRDFWAYRLIPSGTVIRLQGSNEPVAIEHCEKLNKFPKAISSKIKWFRRRGSAWQRCPNSEAQKNYLMELGWPFQTDKLTYQQADFIREKLEASFPTRRKPFIDPENPWSPGSTKPLEGDYRIAQAPNTKQIGFLRFLGIDLPPYFSIDFNSWEALQLIKKNSSLEAFNDWVQKYYWGNLRPTGRQLKVLKFFGMKNTHIVANRAHASTLISGLFSNEKNLDRWEKYKRLTGDYHGDDPNLREFDPEALKTDPV